jgi:hypothetical protein
MDQPLEETPAAVLFLNFQRRTVNIPQEAFIEVLKA